jgi:20S proteasome alpha/beta subunit
VTLAFVLRCTDGLVMASDSRVSGGSRGTADISEKFLQVNRDIGIMTYGLAVPGYRSIRDLVEEVRGNPGQYPSITAITAKAQSVCQQDYQKFVNEVSQPSGIVPPDIANGITGFIISGYDGNDTSKFVIYECTNRNNFQFNEQFGNYFIAAQWHLADWLFPFWGYPGMSVEYGLKVAMVMMILTSTFEPSVGGPIHIATVTIDEGFTQLHEHDVANLVRDVQPFLIALKLGWQEAWNTI